MEFKFVLALYPTAARAAEQQAAVNAGYCGALGMQPAASQRWHRQQTGQLLKRLASTATAAQSGLDTDTTAPTVEHEYAKWEPCMCMSCVAWLVCFDAACVLRFPVLALMPVPADPVQAADFRDTQARCEPAGSSECAGPAAAVPCRCVQGSIKARPTTYSSIRP